MIMRSCGEKKTAREGSGQAGDLWRAVNNGDVFISCELISQVVIGGSAGSDTVKVRHSGLICPCHSLVCCVLKCQCHSLSPLTTPCFVPVVLYRCSSGWWDIILTHPATRTPPLLFVKCYTSPHTCTPLQRNE